MMEPAVFKRQIVDMANETASRLTTDFTSVRAVCDPAELVFGVWPDMGERDGVGMMVVKGRGHLDFILASGISENIKVAAIRCICADQAEALRRVLAGKRDPAARQ